MRFVSSEAKLQVNREKIENRCKVQKRTQNFIEQIYSKSWKPLCLGPIIIYKLLYDQKRTLKYSPIVMNKKHQILHENLVEAVENLKSVSEEQ